MSKTYDECVTLATTTDITSIEHFKLLGGGVNKKAYAINNSSWVVLVAPISKERIVKAEVEQLIKLQKGGVEIPKIGEGKVFNVKVNKEEKVAFLEEAINGFEIDRQGATAFSLDNIKKFGDKVADFICSENDFNLAKSKRNAAINSIEKLKKYLSEEDIPDFQVRFDLESGKILTLDPGDPENSENAREKHLSWVNEWLKVLNDKRYLSTTWNKKHSGDKITEKDW